MKSFVITGARYLTKPEETDRNGPFTHTYLAEGDSWMDASAWNQGSLPEYLVRTYNKLGQTRLVVKISTSGHTLTRIVDMMSKDFAWWLRQQTYSGILFSAGGNDFIDAAVDPDPGQGLLHDLRGQPTPADASACIRAAALKELTTYLDQNFSVIYRAVRGSTKNAATPIYLNAYDTPTARNAPAIEGLSGPWLYTAYTKNGIDSALWPALTALLFGHLAQTVKGWATGRSGVVVVPTVGLLEPAQPGISGESGQWINEIHPNPDGWYRQAQAWVTALG